MPGTGYLDPTPVHVFGVGRQSVSLAKSSQLSIEATPRAMDAAVVVPFMVADRLIAVVGDNAGNEGSDLEAILLPALRATDAFQTVRVRHADLPIAWAMAAWASTTSG
jgi:hypothetical protein